MVIVHGSERAIEILSDSTGEDRRTLIRTLGLCAGIMIVVTVLLAAIPFRRLLRGDPNAGSHALYLVPQALPIAIPVGLIFGILWGFGRGAASRRSRTLVLIVAVASSVASFTMLAWVVPAANQAFRVALSGRPLVMKGVNELTLGELRRLLELRRHEPMALERPHDIYVRDLALNYHTRWALAGAPLVLSIFAVVLTGRRRGRLMLGLVGFTAIFVYYIIMYSARALGLYGTLPAFALAWSPNAVFLLVSVAVMHQRWHTGQ
jgi:lipopolysaccharide export LptBFGC system permease protein LptF